jgi:hypothetical protein
LCDTANLSTKCPFRVIRVVVRNDEVSLTPIADITISHPVYHLPLRN